jgi:hypothetical protein
LKAEKNSINIYKTLQKMYGSGTVSRMQVFMLAKVLKMEEKPLQVMKELAVKQLYELI